MNTLQDYNTLEVDGCQLFLGPLTPAGYGHIGIRLAHRIAWEEANGPIPAGLWVLHKCNNRQCINPEHLALGTAKDNSADLAASGNAKGEKNGNAKLTDVQVALIRQSKEPLKAIMKRYNVSKSAVCKIRAGERWRM